MSGHSTLILPKVLGVSWFGSGHYGAGYSLPLVPVIGTHPEAIYDCFVLLDQWQIWFVVAFPATCGSCP